MSTSKYRISKQIMIIKNIFYVNATISFPFVTTFFPNRDLRSRLDFLRDNGEDFLPRENDEEIDEVFF